jgi:hypothetical protein
VDQQAITAFLGAKRLKPYLDAAGGDILKADHLYHWNMNLGGALHTQISYVEIAARNALDGALAAWNRQQPRPEGAGNFTQEWTAVGGTAEPLYTLLKNELKNARDNAVKESARRNHSHPRRNAPVIHDDIVAQLMFGAWTKLFTDNNATRRNLLWNDALRHAFPNADQTPAGRDRIANRMETMRRLRNKAAHHDNVLNVAVTNRLNEMLSLLRAINVEGPTWAMADSSLRRVAREDPRRNWTV